MNRKCLFGLVIFIVTTISLNAQKSEKDTSGNNFKGFRDKMSSNGISFQPRLTLFQQNFVKGTNSNNSVFAGKADLKIFFNGAKIGLKRLTLVTQLEQNFGQSLNGSGGVAIPLNTATTFPGISGANAFDVTSLYFIYQFGQKNTLLFGKINVIDLAASSLYSGGAGITSFWNMNFAAPVSGITPAYIFGTVASIHTKAFKYTFMVYDPVSAVNTSGLENPFSQGITFSAAIEKKVQIGGLPGSHALKASYSTQDGTDLYDLGDIFFPTPGSTANLEDSRYYFSYRFTQQLGKISNSDKGWGLFGQIGVSDGNPNPVDFGALMGIGGNSFFKSRSEDKWGLGIYYYSFSKPVDEFSEANGIPLRNETGIEMFYEFQINKWLSLGGNTQYIVPLVKNNENAIFLGLRSSIAL
ncbi:carbohydrate porin [Polaribacter sp. MED152]|uniref:carbohydrate porin n=1 Tax=Polaribacter sp. MED152 TaxID=313598 RepID=UPI000068CAEC|nr:carbohydrate porin [Polaribacter sp. MED152]EAQ42445.1 carbohydrate-selective porin, OprB family [Polaribacter sp. MED152]